MSFARTTGRNGKAPSVRPPGKPNVRQPGKTNFPAAPTAPAAPHLPLPRANRGITTKGVTNKENVVHRTVCSIPRLPQSLQKSLEATATTYISALALPLVEYSFEFLPAIEVLRNLPLVNTIFREATFGKRLRNHWIASLSTDAVINDDVCELLARRTLPTLPALNEIIHLKSPPSSCLKIFQVVNLILHSAQRKKAGGGKVHKGKKAMKVQPTSWSNIVACRSATALLCQLNDLNMDRIDPQAVHVIDDYLGDLSPEEASRASRAGAQLLDFVNCVRSYLRMRFQLGTWGDPHHFTQLIGTDLHKRRGATILSCTECQALIDRLRNRSFKR